MARWLRSLPALGWLTLPLGVLVLAALLAASCFGVQPEPPGLEPDAGHGGGADAGAAATDAGSPPIFDAGPASDAGISDAGWMDGEVPDGEVPDGEVPDGEVPDGEVPDAGEGGLELDGG